MKIKCPHCKKTFEYQGEDFKKEKKEIKNKIKEEYEKKIKELKSKDTTKVTAELKKIIQKQVESEFNEKIAKLKNKYLEQEKSYQQEINNLTNDLNLKQRELEIEQRTKNRVSKVIGENLEQYLNTLILNFLNYYI